MSHQHPSTPSVILGWDRLVVLVFLTSYEFFVLVHLCASCIETENWTKRKKRLFRPAEAYCCFTIIIMKITIIITITISIIIRLSSKLLHHCYYDNPPHCHHHHHHHQTSLKEGCRGLSASYSRAPANWLWIRRLSSSNLELLRSTASKIIIIIRVELSTKFCWHFVFAITTVWGHVIFRFSSWCCSSLMIYF